MSTSISEEEYSEARGSYQGWCTTCQEFTRGMTEPDAQDYECPDCGLNCVIGAEVALITEAFQIE
jgi:Zn finger protein HypA/HybF involved in hydrogenase expression